MAPVNSVSAVALGSVTPTCDNARVVPGVIEVQGSGVDSRDSADSREDRKLFTTLQARLALLGYSLTELAGGTFLVSRWNLTLHLSDLIGVRTFLHRVGGGRG